MQPHGLTAARQAPLSMDFSRQEYWSGLHFLLPHCLLMETTGKLHRIVRALFKHTLGLPRNIYEVCLWTNRDESMESELLLLMLFSFRVFKLVIPEEIQMCCNFKITLLRWSFSLRFPWPGRVFPYSAQVHQASTHLNSYCDFSFLSLFLPHPQRLFFLCVPVLEDRTGRLVTAGTEDGTPRGPEPIPSTSVHYADQYCTPDSCQEKDGPQAPSPSLRSPVWPPRLLGHTHSVAALRDCDILKNIYFCLFKRMRDKLFFNVYI